MYFNFATSEEECAFVVSVLTIASVGALTFSRYDSPMFVPATRFPNRSLYLHPQLSAIGGEELDRKL